eukprot:358307-Chlamydomonas_euryale.AAC.6
MNIMYGRLTILAQRLSVLLGLSVLLAPLKQQSYKGTPLRDPDGIAQLVFTRLFSYVADIPDIGDSACMMASGNSAKPCESCMVTPDCSADAQWAPASKAR